MKNFFLLICIFLPFFAKAQNLAVYALGGLATYQGDLQSSRFAINQSNPALGVGLLYNVSSKFLVRGGFTYGKIEGDDKKNTINKSTIPRNLKFASNITEGHIALEYNLFDMEERSLTPYVFAGAAVYHFNPYTNDAAGNKHFLQPLSTEGQGLVAYPSKKPYNLTQFAIPIGGGIKIAVTDNVQFAIEIGLRKLFTDYLDDVSSTYANRNLLLAARGSKAVELAFRGNEIAPAANYPTVGDQRGNPKSKDWYYFSGVRLSKTLNFNNSGGNGRKSKTGCPGVVL